MLKEFKGDKKEIHHKVVGFSVEETKEVKTDKGEFGIIKGYAATYDNVDRGGDIIKKGAFVKSIKRHLDENRQVRMFFQHNYMFPIGAFPADKIVDDEKGLLVEGHINLNADKGRSTYELIKQGAISDLSIGYSINDAVVDKEGNLNLIDLELWETSPVSEPMNPEANILSVKGATSFKDLPLADRNRPWSKSDAQARVREFTGSQEEPSARYRTAFFWFDSADAKNFGAYKLPFADVINGTLTAVPRGIFAAAARLNQTDIPEGDKKRVATHINRYYDKMGLESPLKNADIAEHYKIIFEILEDEENDKVQTIESLSSLKETEAYLKQNFLSIKESKTLISKIKSFSRDVKSDEDTQRDADSTKEIEENESNIVNKIKSIADHVERSNLLSKLNSIKTQFKGDNHARSK